MNLPPLELLESTHDFPGPFVFKAIGKNEDNFAERIIDAVCLEIQQGADIPYELRHTSGGRHVSITLTPHTESADHVLRIYERIRVIEGLVMLL